MVKIAAVLCLCAGLAAAQAGGDLQARIVYAYQVEDLNELAALVQSLSADAGSDGADPARLYHLAHARYRMALLLAAARPEEAQASFADCVASLKGVLRRQPDAAEALALQSACYANLANFRRFEAPVLRAQAAERLDAARRLAPHNPRVLYLSAMELLARAAPQSPERQRALAQLQAAAREFERSSGTSPDAPGWGHAEAYLALGTELRARGDLLGARNWIEKALIAAPDYKAAQREQSLLLRAG